MDHRHRLTLFGLACLLGLTLVVTLWWSPARAQDCPACSHTTISIKIPVDATVVDSDSPCQEPVHVTGNVHLVVEVRQEAGLADITADMNLADVKGEGKFTGAKYLATGAAQMVFAQQALPTSVTIRGLFAWNPLVHNQATFLGMTRCGSHSQL